MWLEDRGTLLPRQKTVCQRTSLECSAKFQSHSGVKKGRLWDGRVFI